MFEASRRGTLVALAAILSLLGLPESASTEFDAFEWSVYCGLTKAEFRLCRACCEEKECSARDPEPRPAKGSAMWTADPALVEPSIPPVRAIEKRA